MFIRAMLVSAFFLVIGSFSLQANVDTRLDYPSNITGQTVLLMAYGNASQGISDRRGRRADRIDARRGVDQDADPCDAADNCYDACDDDDDDCWDSCDEQYPDCEDECDVADDCYDACDDDDDDCWDACDDKFPECADD